MTEGEASAPAQGANRYSHGNSTDVFEARHTTIVHVAIIAAGRREAHRGIIEADAQNRPFYSDPGSLELLLGSYGGEHGA